VVWFFTVSERSTVFPETDDKINVKETYYIQLMMIYTHALTKSMGKSL